MRSQRFWSAFTSFVVIGIVDAVLARGAWSQLQGPPPELLCDTIQAWVDPWYGVDPSPDITASINDETRPYRTLQAAIDACQLDLDKIYVTSPPSKTVGIVYALPGIYGPGASGDVLPIKMRDRVHVRAADARSCIIRGVGASNQWVFWPDAPTMGSYRQAEVLVDFTTETDQEQTPVYPPTFPLAHPLAWKDLGDTLEMFNAFTLQGGTIQVLFGTEGLVVGDPTPRPLRGLIANCVFDMRDNWKQHSGDSQAIAGPSFGIMMQKHFVYTPDPAGGYYDQQAIIINNTFIMAEWGKLNPNSSPTWINDAKSDYISGAVAIMDVTDPGCDIGVPHDKDLTLRGVGNPMIINNLFRTRFIDNTSWTKSMAMVGIAREDVLVEAHSQSGAGPLINTNAFAAGRVGADTRNGSSGPFQTTFYSEPTNSINSGGRWDCHSPFAVETNVDCLSTVQVPPCPAAPLPEPIQYIFENNTSGHAEYDPGFVGEYLATAPGLVSPPAPFYTYRDWRLLPDSASPMKDLGIVVPISTTGGFDFLATSVTVAAPFPYVTTYSDPKCPDLQVSRWDGEGHGNPRTVNGAPDIGFDELHAFVMAGSYFNDSKSHNWTSLLVPTAAQGIGDRYVLIPPEYYGPNVTIRVNGTQRPMPTIPNPLAGWTVPPAALGTPVLESGHPVDYSARYINFSNPSNQQVPTPWTPATASAPISFHSLGVNNPGQPSFHFTQYKIPDDEHNYPQGPGFVTGYFCTQVVITGDLTTTNVVRLSNLQWEIR